MSRRAFAPEVVQTSAMDCGPAALKCLLEGHGVPVSYGRLREACQTDVDGTSIDTLEDVANRLGLATQQVLVPADHVLRGALPALAVVRHVDAATHFVVVWRRVGGWVQVMDPAAGRRWVRADRLQAELYRHRMTVPAADWRAAAGEPEFRDALRQRLAALAGGQALSLVDDALAQPGWRPVATLDAALRQVQALVTAGGVARGAEALALLQALLLCSLAAADPCRDLPPACWSVLPQGDGSQLLVQGAVLLRTAGRQPASAALPPELAAALAEPPPRVFAAVWQLACAEGRPAPWALAGAAALAALVLAFEALLLRGLLDLSALLATPGQRVGAAAGLLVLLALVLLLELPLLGEALRQGRQVETRLRLALLDRLPRLPDRWFHSRPLSDMAERAHGLQATRALPLLALAGVQAAVEGLFTLAAVCWLAPDSSGLACALFGAALGMPLAAQPLLAERDLRARQHAGALAGHTLDALLGVQPLRAHRAGRALAAQHEATLVEWTLAARAWLRAALGVDAVQSTVCTTLAVVLVARHFVLSGTVAGSDLLLVFWVLKLPALGSRFAGLALQVPVQRNVLLRLLEPLGAPEAPVAAAPTGARGPMALAIHQGRVLAAGHEILREVELQIAAGEHVAIVGVSGAGKSSLLGLLLGWHRLAEGRLEVDDRPQQPGDAAAHRRATAWVDPAVQLWNRSLHDNLTAGLDAPGGARLGPVLEAARLRGLLARLPQGLQTLLGEGGTRLSGGEGQRVRLGRALLMPAPRLVLLDEPFRGLDRPQRQGLLAEARRWWATQTLLCVTHDVGETLAFPRVLVIEDGRIVEDGAPAALAAAPSRYRALLDAEQALQHALWRDGGWRRLRVHDGRVEAAR